jgi:hypothetical protein
VFISKHTHTHTHARAHNLGRMINAFNDSYYTTITMIADSTTCYNLLAAYREGTKQTPGMGSVCMCVCVSVCEQEYTYYTHVYVHVCVRASIICIWGHI